MFGKQMGRWIAFDISNTTFESGGMRLSGFSSCRKARGKRRSSCWCEHDSVLDSYVLQRMFPAQGIGAFVFDKRGTGASGGVYTQDLDVLRKTGGSSGIVGVGRYLIRDRKKRRLLEAGQGSWDTFGHGGGMTQDLYADKTISRKSASVCNGTSAGLVAKQLTQCGYRRTA